MLYLLKLCLLSLFLDVFALMLSKMYDNFSDVGIHYNIAAGEYYWLQNIGLNAYKFANAKKIKLS